MTDTVAVVAVVVVVAGLAGAAPVVASVGSGPAAQTTPAHDSAGNESGMSPGERMAGVVGAERAAVENEVTVRAFGQRVAAANSSAARARVVGTQTDGLQARLDGLDAHRAELERAHENGTLSTGQYRARLAKLYAEQRALQRLANLTERVARDLPEQARRAQGVNVSAIRTLQSSARNLTGPEVADIARGVAGKGVGRPADGGPPDFANETRGPPGGEGPPGQSDEDGPPGQSDEDGPPGRADGNESAGQSGEDGPPERADGNESAGQSGEDGPPGQAGNGTGSDTGDGGSQQPTDAGPGNGSEDRGGNGDENGSESPDGNGDDSGNSGENGNGDDNGNGDNNRNSGGTGGGGGSDDAAKDAAHDGT